ncbi:MAG: tRNA preQ1(34) S-adenosylmethionine ribosyltransferase-isomerase QueA [Acuticoccus sp.]
MPPTTDPVAGEARAADGTRLADYDFDLPDGRIALRPCAPRDAARLLFWHAGAAIDDRTVRDLPQLLAPGDRLVVNDSKVIPARLAGLRVREEGAAQVEITLIAQEGPLHWRGFARPAKRLRPGDRVEFAGTAGRAAASVVAREGPSVRLAFESDPLVAGAMPLPPYIAARRAPDARDEGDYQTVYAEPPGSVAAPTAGLHFTDALLGALAERGIATTRLTLHVGPGTFLPVTADSVDDHEMHAERGIVTEAAAAQIAATRAAGGRIIAVGTTALRLLESAAASGTLRPFDGDTRLFIRPGFAFHVADGLMTNFHLPRSTLLMLVAAFTGLDAQRAIYHHALTHDYRFYSYGDASLLLRR